MTASASRSILIALGSSVALAGCHHAAPPALAPIAAVNQDSITAARLARARADSLARADQLRRETAERDAARNDSLRLPRARAEREARDAIEAKIFFDYDRDALSDAARSTLEQKLAALSAHPSVRIRVEGNTDERGSDEYNLALGQRRAAAAKRYLVEHGIVESRIEIISDGEERPACQSHDESCWSQNRRDAFVVTSGSTAATVP